jgi:hypothetical protein
MTPRSPATSRTGGTRGFSLIELGIAIGVIVTMTIVVMSVRGFLESAKIGAAVTMVDTLQKASRAWSERKANSTGFLATDGTPVSVQALQDELLIPGTNPTEFLTPWDTAVAVAPTGAQNDRIIISFSVPTAPSATDCVTALQKMGTATNPTATSVELNTR